MVRMVTGLEATGRDLQQTGDQWEMTQKQISLKNLEEFLPSRLTQPWPLVHFLLSVGLLFKVSLVVEF